MLSPTQVHNRKTLEALVVDYDLFKLVFRCNNNSSVKDKRLGYSAKYG